MTLEIVWSYPALYDLRSIHWLPGADIDAAIMRFATTGQGSLVQVPDQPSLRILRVGRCGDLRGAVSADFPCGRGRGRSDGPYGRSIGRVGVHPPEPRGGVDLT